MSKRMDVEKFNKLLKPKESIIGHGVSISCDDNGSISYSGDASIVFNGIAMNLSQFRELMEKENNV